MKVKYCAVLTQNEKQKLSIQEQLQGLYEKEIDIKKLPDQKEHLQQKVDNLEAKRRL